MRPPLGPDTTPFSLNASPSGCEIFKLANLGEPAYSGSIPHFPRFGDKQVFSTTRNDCTQKRAKGPCAFAKKGEFRGRGGPSLAPDRRCMGDGAKRQNRGRKA